MKMRKVMRAARHSQKMNHGKIGMMRKIERVRELKKARACSKNEGRAIPAAGTRAPPNWAWRVLFDLRGQRVKLRKRPHEELHCSKLSSLERLPTDSSHRLSAVLAFCSGEAKNSDGVALASIDQDVCTSAFRPPLRPINWPNVK